MNHGQRLYEDLLADQCDPAMDAYWPEANSILASVSKVQQLDAFYAHATIWSFNHLFEPWAPETNDFFAAMLNAKHTAPIADKVHMLLRLWTKAGTQLPQKNHQNAIGNYLAQCDPITGARLLGYAPIASQTLPAETKQQWMDLAISYARVPTARASNPLALFAYYNGAINILNDEQKDAALRRFVDPPEMWSPPLSAGPLLAPNHPEVDRLQLAYLHRILHASFQQGSDSCLRKGMQTAFQCTIMDWPSNMDTRGAMHQAQILVLGALFERCIPGTIQSLPGPWRLVQEMLPVIEGLHAVEWSPEQSVSTVLTMAQAFLPTLLAPSTPLVEIELPPDWLALP